MDNDLKIITGVLISIGIFIFFRWVGLKGLLSFILGMITSTYLILSKNKMFEFIAESFSKEKWK